MLGQEEPSLGELEQLIDRTVEPIDLLTAALIIVGALVLAWGFRRLTRWAIERWRGTSPGLADLIGRLVAYAIVVLGVAFAVPFAGLRISPALIIFSILVVLVIVAGQGIISNVASGIVLQTWAPFTVGQQVTIAETSGTVRETNGRFTVVDSFDGTEVHVPNSTVLEGIITNLTARGSRRSVLEVPVAYGSDLDRARDVVLNAVGGADGVLAEPKPDVFVVRFDDSAIILRVHVWHAPEQPGLWRIQDAANRAAKSALEAAGIEIPLPQRIVSRRSDASHGPDQAEE